MPKKNSDPLSGLDASLDAESSVVAKRFTDAERFTSQGQRRASSTRHAHAAHAERDAPHPPVVRDAFSFPATDHQLIAQLQARCLADGWTATKSELVRAGLHALAAMQAPAFRQALRNLEKLRPGRTRRAIVRPTASV